MPKEATLPKRTKLSDADKQVHKMDKEMRLHFRSMRSPEELAEIKERHKADLRRASKERRDYLKSMDPEELAMHKSNKAYDKLAKKQEKVRKHHLRKTKLIVKSQIALLEYMLKNETYWYHHGTRDLMTEDITERINKMKESLKENPVYKEYHPYIWNYYGQGKNYMLMTLLGHLWTSREFKSINSVPLDGTYYFYCYDSGQRGSGSFHYMSAARVGEGPAVPFVNPGGIPQITV
jgi:hypothetical protein